jgi:pyroglutamyl-peptidase
MMSGANPYSNKVLVTGFELYGGWARNPAAEIARGLDGGAIAGHQVIGRTLPVAYVGLAERLEALVDELRPVVVIALGLAPGEPLIRLERFGLNLADFEIADNEGLRLDDAVIAANGATALRASLPLRAIERALLENGIPARLSSTAGSYLCNAALYHLMRILENRSPPSLGGFIHLPYIPEQVASMLAEGNPRSALHQEAHLASMELPLQIKAVSIAIAATLAPAKRP